MTYLNDFLDNSSQIILESFNEIKIGNYVYKYKNVDFLFKNNKKKKILVSFHGASSLYNRTGNYPNYTFRCYNYNLENFDILAISDYYLHKLKSQLFFYFGCTKINNIYNEIIENILLKYDSAVFFGTSGGSYPAIRFSSELLKKIDLKVDVIICNPIKLYLENYKNINEIKKFLTVNNVVNDNNFKIFNIENIINESNIINNKKFNIIVYSNEDVKKPKPHFEISHSGGREEIPGILSQMIEHGLKVTSFTTRKSKVEDLFLEIESGSSEFDQN